MSKQGRRYASLEDRLLRNSVISETSFYNGTPCWIWTGPKRANRCGLYYGHFNVWDKRRKTVKHELVHRAIIRDIHGYRVTRRTVGMHRCNNTLCCNPEHVAGGSQKMNMRQMVEDGRNSNGN